MIERKIIKFLTFHTILLVGMQSLLASVGRPDNKINLPTSPITNSNLFPEQDFFVGINSSTLVKLEKDYFIFGNVPLNVSEFILFAEIHTISTHLQLLQKYIPILSKSGDYLLLEGTASLIPTDCEKGGQTKFVQLGINLKCLGWDNPNADVGEKIVEICRRYDISFAKRFAKNPKLFIKNTKEIHKYLNGFDSALQLTSPKKLKNMEDQVKAIERLNIDKKEKETKLLQVADRLGYHLYRALTYVRTPEYIEEKYYAIFGSKLVQSFHEEISKILQSHSGSSSIVERNTFLISTMSSLKCKNSTVWAVNCSRKLVVAGALHLFDIDISTARIDTDTGKVRYHFNGIEDDQRDQILLFSKMSRWNKTSPHYQIREFLKKEKYTILYPR